MKECLKSFEEKTFLRVKELEKGNINGLLKKDDNIAKKINISELDYTKHELESFVELIQNTKGIHTVMFFDKTSSLWYGHGPYPNPNLRFPSILYYDDNYRAQLLINDKLEYYEKI